MVLPQRSLHQLLHLIVKYFNFEFTQKMQTQLKCLNILYLYGILLDQNNQLLSQVSKHFNQESSTRVLPPLHFLLDVHLESVYTPKPGSTACETQ